MLWRFPPSKKGKKPSNMILGHITATPLPVHINTSNAVTPAARDAVKTIEDVLEEHEETLEHLKASDAETRSVRRRASRRMDGRPPQHRGESCATLLGSSRLQFLLQDCAAAILRATGSGGTMGAADSLSQWRCDFANPSAKRVRELKPA